MKKIISLILCICCFLGILVGCSLFPVREYSGTPLKNLTFKTVDYMGGYTKTYLFDFENNVIKTKSFSPFNSEGEEPDFTVIKEFTNEQEKTLIDKLYSYGLFKIKAQYKNSNVVDGGGWDLVIEYEDGTTKKSTGSNSAPTKVFEKCAKAFYDLCENGVVSSVPREYYCPPNLSYSFKFNNGTFGYSSYGKMLDYAWNGFGKTGNDIYEANQTTKFSHEFFNGIEYTLVLYTANYNNSYDYARFKKCTLISYDYNENLTGKVTEYSSGWFKQVELKLELNRIYLLRLDFRNGDYVTYTFNTKVIENVN